MANEITDQPMAAIDPNAHLRVQMRALGTQGKSLGKVETLDRNATTGQLTALVIRHGLFGNKLTTVPASRVKWVNSDSVILDLTPSAFKKLAQIPAS
jgi:sporulation protein YlmC with PRC-barrel domain